MSEVKKMFGNVSWLVFSQIIITICTFLWTILIARYLGVSDYGIYGFAISLTGILIIIADFGINTHIVRDVATNRDIAPKYLGNSIPLKSIFAVVTFVVMFVILVLMKADELTIEVTFLFAVAMIVNSFINLFKGSFQAFEEVKYQGIGDCISHVLLLLFIIISIYSDIGIYGIAISYILVYSITLSYLYYALNKNVVNPKYGFDAEFCRKITIMSAPFAITGILYSAYYFIDIIMLENIVGSYAAEYLMQHTN